MSDGSSEPARFNSRPDRGDIPDDEFREALDRVAEIAASYLASVERFDVLPAISPGDVAAQIPSAPPETGEPLERLIDDYKAFIEPNVTHWNHPGFMAYFGITGSRPGLLGETLAASLNVNAMLWRSSPAATELEERATDWLRQLVGLPEGFVGHINDTASISTMLALAAAREGLGFDVREKGLAGRSDVPPLVTYTSEEAHSSVDKAAMTLGLGHANVRRIGTDEGFALDPDALLAAIEADLAAGRKPLALVATVGTTSTTSVDPVAALVPICRQFGMWLHVDAAYAGSAAVCPELRRHFDGWQEADSVVINPHKWLFTQVDCSVLFLQDPTLLKAAFSLVPAYLEDDDGATNLMDYGPQLGRRFRSLKLWFVMRAFGAEGLRSRIRGHCELARELGSWVESDPRFEMLAPAPFSTVCFRAVARGCTPEELDVFNRALQNAVHESGAAFISQTQVEGRFALRCAIGNIKTERRHVERLWKFLGESYDQLAASNPVER